MQQTLISRSDFARRKSRTHTCISHWIKIGKISPAALIGKKIWLEKADADLSLSLDPSQQAALAHPIGFSTPQSTTSGEDALLRRRLADADRAEQDAIAAKRKNAVEMGRWVDAEKAAAVWTTQLARIFSDLDVFLSSTLARKLAELHGLDFKQLSIEIRNEYRHYRGAVADAAEKEAADQR